jgi:putative ABC transport system substrate-binding protein
MQRREFITFIGSTVAWPLAARAQQPAMPVIGVLSVGSLIPDLDAAFERGLAERGYVVGKDVRIERRSAQGNYDRLP